MHYRVHVVILNHECGELEAIIGEVSKPEIKPVYFKIHRL